MANKNDNLIPQAHKLTLEEQSNGGKASGEARRRKKELKECIEMLLESDIKAKNGDVMSGAEAIATKLFEKALRGDIKAFEVVRDTAGQKPVEKVQVASVDQETIDKVEAIFNDAGAGSTEA